MLWTSGPVDAKGNLPPIGSAQGGRGGQQGCLLLQVQSDRAQIPLHVTHHSLSIGAMPLSPLFVGIAVR